MTAIVTGATGFIGSNLVRTLASMGERLIILGRRPLARPGTEVTHVPFDLAKPGALDRRKLADAIGNAADVCLYHVAAAMPRHGRIDAGALMLANGAATHHSFQMCAELGVTRMVYASGTLVYGVPRGSAFSTASPPAPADAYGFSKLAGECAAAAVAEANGTNIAVLRIASPYGPGMQASTILPIFAARALRGDPFGWYGTGSRAQDFVHIDDVVSAFIAGSKVKGFQTINVASGQPVANSDLAMMVKRLVPESASVVAPANLPDPEEGMVWRVDISGGGTIGWAPRMTLEDGLTGYIASLRHR